MTPVRWPVSGLAEADAERIELRGELEAAEATIAEQSARIDAVLAVHVPVEDWGAVCGHDMRAWPCPTARALGAQ